MTSRGRWGGVGLASCPENGWMGKDGVVRSKVAVFRMSSPSTSLTLLLSSFPSFVLFSVTLLQYTRSQCSDSPSFVIHHSPFLHFCTGYGKTIPCVPDGHHTSPLHSPQVLLEARSQLEVLVDSQLDDAVSRRDQVAVLRFARLYKPLGKQVGGGGAKLKYAYVVLGLMGEGREI